MAQQDRNVHLGDIATYESASDDFLKKRKADLQDEIRHPHLNAGEYARKVLANMAVAVIATGWTVWWGIDRLVETGRGWMSRHREALDPFLSISAVDKEGKLLAGKERIHYLHDKETYEKGLREVTQDWARWYFKGTRDHAPTASHMVDIIIDTGKPQGFTTGENELIHFRDHVLPKITTPDPEILKRVIKLETEQAKKGLDSKDAELIAQKVAEATAAAPAIALEETRREALVKVLGTLDEHSHAAQYHKLFEAMKARVEEIFRNGDIVTSEQSLASKTFRDTGKEIIDKALNDNARMVNRVRIPLAGALVVGVAAVAGVANSKNARKQKALEQESELTHIERLQRERRHAATQDIASTTIGLS